MIANKVIPENWLLFINFEKFTPVNRPFEMHNADPSYLTIRLLGSLIFAGHLNVTSCFKFVLVRKFS